MKLLLLFIGKSKDAYLKQELAKFSKRTQAFCSMELVELDDVKQAKNLSPDQLKAAEAEKFNKQFKPTDAVFLLDEKGKQYSSKAFADFIEKQLRESSGRMVFCIGGAFGFDEGLKQKSRGLISLSKMTMNHQIARLVLTEQVYRAFTILNNHPYHNE